MTRRLCLWTLLALVPLTNIRMICFDHADGVRPRVGTEVACGDTCPRDAAPEDDGSCLLVAGGCSAMMAFAVALPNPAVGLSRPAATILQRAEQPLLYFAPVPATLSPPPEA